MINTARRPHKKGSTPTVSETELAGSAGSKVLEGLVDDPMRMATCLNRSLGVLSVEVVAVEEEEIHLGDNRDRDLQKETTWKRPSRSRSWKQRTALLAKLQSRRWWIVSPVLEVG